MFRGQSHSWLRPASKWLAPIADTISEPEGSKLTITCCGAEPSISAIAMACLSIEIPAVCSCVQIWQRFSSQLFLGTCEATRTVEGIYNLPLLPFGACCRRVAAPHIAGCCSGLWLCDVVVCSSNVIHLEYNPMHARMSMSMHLPRNLFALLRSSKSTSFKDITNPGFIFPSSN